MDYRQDIFALLHSLMKKMGKLADDELHSLRIPILNVLWRR